MLSHLNLFSGSIGAFEGMAVGSANPSGVTYVVSRDTTGALDATTFSLAMTGIPSPNIPVDATANQVNSYGES